MSHCWTRFYKIYKNVDDGVKIQDNAKIEGDEEIKARGDKCVGKIPFD